MSKIYDKTGREIMRGDIVKVFHFIGPRRKRYYMYKQAAGHNTLGGSQYMKMTHLDINDPDDGWHELLDDKMRPHFEIVQSLDAKFEDRPRYELVGIGQRGD
jgi:hypothetical protein